MDEANAVLQPATDLVEVTLTERLVTRTQLCETRWRWQRETGEFEYNL